MEADSSPHGPRRSQREKKQPKPITTVTAVPGTRRKRKHAETDDEDAPRDTDGDIEEEEEAGDEPDVDEEDEDDHVSRPKRSRKAKTGPPAKRARKEATTATGENTRKPRKPRTAKQVVDPNAPFDPEALEKATNIKADNPLFNAILNPNAALRSTAEDFLESLGQSPDAALAELVNLILRCCGSNAAVDGDTAVDYDGVVDRLDDIVEDLKKTTTPAGTYPLVSKAVPFHNAKAKYNFRAHLSEFISHLIEVAADVDSLYTTPLIETLQVWLVPMSSSQIRSIRHTATVFALEVESALCEVGKQVERNVELAARQREGEKKRAKSGTTPSTKGKEKEMEARLKSLKENQAKLEEFIKEFIDGVFIHRYRDLDPVIRAECISFLSTFFSVLPSHFAANSNYLRYVGWVLSDSAAQVRLAAVKALQAVYDTAGIKGQKRKKTVGAAGNNKDTGGVSLSALSHFTTRFLPRLLEIAQFDVDVAVRVAVMGVLGCVDEIGLLSDSDRNRLGTMVFSDEPRIRKGVGKFVSGVWEEWVEAKLNEVEVEAHAQAAVSNRGKGRSRGGRGGATGKGRGAKSKRVAIDEEVDEGKVGIKALVSLLARWGRALNRKGKQQGDEDDEEDEEADEEERKRKAENDRDTESDAARERGGVAATLATTTTFMGFVKKADGPAAGAAGTSGATVNRAGYDSIAKGRTALVVEAVWDELDIVRDWEGILDMLVLDHSASGSENGIIAPASKRGKGKPGSKRRKMKPKRRSNATNGDEENADSEEEQTQNNDEEDDDAESSVTRVHEAWRLYENEEGILLEVLVASMRRTRKDDETTIETITQALMKALPSLFIKYQTDETRIADVLVLPTLMNLEVYLEMRETSAYSALWSDVSKQFLTHSSPYVVTTAVHTITYMLANTSLSNINSEQILELEDELATSLRDAAAGPISPPGSPSKASEPPTSKRASRDIETDHLSEDEVINLTSIILRLRILVGSRDMTAWIEENEGGKQSSVWDILSAVSERGRLAIGGEEGMVEQSLQVLALHVMWKSRGLTITSAGSTKEERIHRESLLSQRNSLLERLIEFAVGTQEVGNGIADGVKRMAFKNLLDLHILFAGLPIPDGADDMEAVALTMDDEVQWRCAGYVQAEVERYAESLRLSDVGEEGDEDNSDEGSEGGDDADERAKDKSKIMAKTAKKKESKQAEEGDEDQTLVDEDSRDRLEMETLFLDVISTFLRSIRVGAIHVRHGAILLAHYGRLGSSFDAFAKVVIEVLKEEGIMNDQPDTIVLVVTQAMKEAFAIAASSRSPDESDVVALARLLASCFVIRGSQLAVLRRLEAQYVVSVQTNLLTWIANQLATHQDSGDKKGLKTSLLFYRTLIPLVGSIESRDALKIKAHLDQVLAHAKVEPATTKAWEPYRAYEKRLGTVMSKDKPGGTKGRSKKKKSGVLTDGEESEVERLIEDDEGALSDASAPVEPPHPRPQRPRRNKTRGKKPLEDIEENGQEENEVAEDPATPKARPRPRRAYKTRAKASEKEVVQENVDPAAPLSPLTEEEAAPSAEVPIIPTPTQNGFVTPKKKLKRNREDDDDGDAHPSASEGPGSEQPEPPEATPAADVQIRRKRIRH
ncbi:mitotic cohesin complex [Moniliophthora roreri]|uniref:SCD domain-containing protein n=1 Tax=Moniliophthora roreri TaxID=221103 RepID=A0A0W0EZH4_MONRR|nr:mitotic cohesin complex [Moniliophthora roreri]